MIYGEVQGEVAQVVDSSLILKGAIRADTPLPFLSDRDAKRARVKGPHLFTHPSHTVSGMSAHAAAKPKQT